MATHNPNGSVVRNDGGTIVKGGNSDGTVVKTTTLVELAQDRSISPVTVLEINSVDKAVTSGTFAYQPELGEDFLLRTAGPNASKLNGSASVVLVIGGHATDRYDGIMEKVDYRDANGNDVFLGNDTAAGPVGPSRAVPAKLTYMFGGKASKLDEYKAMDTHE